jgi:hypothetical protein
MIVCPTVDIRNGRCAVDQGIPESEVVFHEDPTAQPTIWVADGAEAVHVVNLNGTLSYPASGARNRRRTGCRGGSRRRTPSCRLQDPARRRTGWVVFSAAMNP